MDILKNIEQLIDNNELEEALTALDEEYKTQDAGKKMEIHLLKGRIFQKQHKWGEMINQYNDVLETDPENKTAKTGIDMANSILNFYNPEMFNP